MNIVETNSINITWQHVSAISGIAGNEVADKLALQAAKKETTDIQGPKEITSCVKSTSSNEK